MEVKLLFPTSHFKIQILEYKADFIKNKENMAGTAGLETAESFELWYSDLKNNLKEETVKEGMVPSTTYLAVDENDSLLGMIDIRHRLNDHLMKAGGHIGYSVNKKHRQKGIATTMLALAIDKCKELDIKDILVTCSKENTASAKTIMNNGGVLENEIVENDKITQRYWIRV